MIRRKNKFKFHFSRNKKPSELSPHSRKLMQSVGGFHTCAVTISTHENQRTSNTERDITTSAWAEYQYDDKSIRQEDNKRLRLQYRGTTPNTSRWQDEINDDE